MGLKAIGMTICAVAISAAVSAGSAGAAEGQGKLGTTKLRVGDLKQSVEFFEKVFGMQQTAQYDTPFPPGGPRLQEVALNFGATPEEAKANKGGSLVLMYRPEAATQYHATDDLPNFVITVPDMNQLVQRVKDNNASFYLTPFKLSPKITVAMPKDPSGNVIECIEIKQ